MASAGTSIGRVCEIAIDADFQLHTALGSDLSTTVAFVEYIIHKVDEIFERDTGVSIQLSTLVVRTSPAQPYTSNTPPVLLSQARVEWNGNLAGAQRDVVHLMTGRNLTSSLTRLGFADSICSPEAFAVTRSLWSADPDVQVWTTANMLAVNMGAVACDGDPDCRIMCTLPGGCSGADLTSFGAVAAATISANAAGYSCLRDLAAPLALPILETFPSDTADEDVWVSNPFEGPSSGAASPPSAPFAALLTASSSLEGLDDRWITNKILAGSASGVTVSYQVQHRGVPSSRQLLVEFLDTGGQWQPLDAAVSDGTNQTTFTARTVALPASGNHDGLQLRFTADVNGPSEEWFVDDLSVQAEIQTYCTAGANSVSPDGAHLWVSPGSTASIGTNNLEFAATACPPNSFGIYLYSSDRSQTPLGDGFLCVTGQPIFRAALEQADAFGLSTFALDQAALPPGSSILPGDTVRFQLWYRDSIGAGFNLTNGVEATFVP